jgi:CelD/BcsL family acetyltransferase involved in cellulose biosynthesis
MIAPATAPVPTAIRPAMPSVVPHAAIGSAALTVDSVDDTRGFTALRPHWDALLQASAADTPFLTWEWLRSWWAHLRGASRLALIVVRAGEQPVAIAPLRSVAGTLPWMSRLEFVGTGLAGSDYLDLIVRRGHEEASLDALARHLRRRQLALRFTHLPPSSMAARLADRLAADGWIRTSAPDGRCPLVPLAGHTFDSYLATLGSSHRANVRRRLKALTQKFDVRFETVTSDEERRRVLATLGAFSQKRWKDQGGSSAFMTSEARAFQDEATGRALRRGWLRLHVLRLDGVAAAVMYGFQYRDRFFFYQHGFDDRFREHSVGLVLMGLSIRAAIEEGARAFDMLWGEEPYKFLWARESTTLERIDLFPRHLGGRLQRHTVTARRHAGRLARRVQSLGESLGF